MSRFTGLVICFEFRGTIKVAATQRIFCEGGSCLEVQKLFQILTLGAVSACSA